MYDCLLDIEEEIWNDAVGYEQYLKVSNFGNIIKKERSWICGNRNGKITKPEHALIPRLNLGYLVIDVYVNNKNKILKVHRLVALTFIPNPENKPEVNHKDLNRSNPRASNLEWATRKENTIHARKYKTNWKKRIEGLKGIDHPKAKLKDNDIVAIRLSSLRNFELAKIYNMNGSTICRIRNKKYWKHIS